jgi:mycoredoxin
MKTAILAKITLLKTIILNLAVIVAFGFAGFWLAPHARSAYEGIFPTPAFVNGNYSAIFQEAGKPVVMFSTSTCSHCAHAREYLSKAQIDYRDFVIDQSPDAKQRFDALGGDGVPLLFIGDRRITGFREDTIHESLALIRH